MLVQFGVPTDTFFNNYCKLGNRDRVDFTVSGWSRSIERDVLVQGTVSGIRIGTNNYE